MSKTELWALIAGHFLHVSLTHGWDCSLRGHMDESYRLFALDDHAFPGGTSMNQGFCNFTDPDCQPIQGLQET